MRLDQTPEAARAFTHLRWEVERYGSDVPCVGPGAAAWTSENARDRESAADRCIECPAFAACEAARFHAWPTHGVWAGIDQTGRNHYRPSTAKPQINLTERQAS